MKQLFYTFIFISLLYSCTKEHDSYNNSNGQQNAPTVPVPVTTISLSINDSSIDLTSFEYNRSNSTFDFTGRNVLNKIDVRCFWFIQYGKYSFQYSDSINYSYRRDTLSEWTTIRAVNYGDISFDCCKAPLTDKVITGNFSGTFPAGRQKYKIKGLFSLVF